jgi:hypothetical protein
MKPGITGFPAPKVLAGYGKQRLRPDAVVSVHVSHMLPRKRRWKMASREFNAWVPDPDLDPRNNNGSFIFTPGQARPFLGWPPGSIFAAFLFAVPLVSVPRLHRQVVLVISLMLLMGIAIHHTCVGDGLLD